jgi:hypothetical protein
VVQRTWLATLSVNKERRLGWNCHTGTYQSLVNAFEKFVELKQIHTLSRARVPCEKSGECLCCVVVPE